ncbi:Uma2 family endonuclease [Methylobacterium trifolii]|uniref:Putative restriction endonuclease domain-containing protein n=1 Tax=Methylobacterium trifolii TaxID=1003092 RepID=A0ABQ4U7V7_9HYPH|nr:Uma2 family endonuclease [Methylobacterium trifolii]GJE62235.1 hypothetical protein MPOCJGCO_4366 [Methylobacterium trifolii]
MTDPAVIERSMTLDGFLAFLEERPTGERWELDDGTPVMNPLPTRRHDWIQTNILLALRIHRRSHQSPWRPAGPSQVPVPGRNRTVAPDVLVAPEAERDDVSITPDPIVVFEVLSRSDTRARRARKQDDYEAITSIRHYVVVRQDRREVVAYRRAADGRFAIDPAGDTIELTAIGATLTIAEIYAETLLAE